MSRELQKFLTEDQNINILKDQALFSETQNSRIRAISKLVDEYGTRAIPAIMEVIDSLPQTDKAFKVFCQNVIEKAKS